MHKSLLKWFQEHQAGNIEGAINYYESHVKSFPNDINGWQLLGIGYGQLEMLDSALAAFKRGLDIEPDNITLHNNIGHVYTKLNQYDLSEEHFNIVLSIQPGHLGVLKNLGLLHYKQKQFVTAEAYFAKALSVSEQNEDLLHNLGLSQFNQKKLKPATRSFLDALKSNPLNQAVLINLGECYLQQSLYDDAVTYFKKALIIEPSFRIHHGLGCAYLGNDESDKALLSFNKAYELEPFNFENCHNLASVYFHQQKLGEALQCWFQCLQMNPKCEQTLYNIGVCYQYKNKFEDASSYFHKVLMLNPNHGDTLHNLGTLALKQNKPNDAIPFYERALTLMPDNVQVKFLLAALKQSKQADFTQCPKAYVSQLFDDYASTYDDHLTQVLKYSGHEKLSELIQDVLEPKKEQWHHTVDLGCGTGLAATYIKPWSKILTGVDCSKNMITIANKTACYDSFIEGFIPDIQWPEKVDLFFIADCLPYIGDLTQVIEQMSSVLNQNGVIACSIENTSDSKETYCLSVSGRFKHNRDYLIDLMAQYGCLLLKHEKTNIRYEQHQPVRNELFIFHKVS